MKIDIRHLIKEIRKTVDSHCLGGGKYARYLWADSEGKRKLGNNEYGAADAANILYTIGDFPRDAKLRNEFIENLRSFQHDDGIFDEKSHHKIHCTAHCIAALELFDALPNDTSLSGLDEYKTPDGLISLLEGLDWNTKVWSEAHKGAGIYAAFVLTGNANEDWQNCYFDWLTKHTDKKYGMSCEGEIDKGGALFASHLNGWFHYLFNFTFARRPIPEAKRLVDSCIEMYGDKSKNLDFFGKIAGFAEIDWIYSLNRAARQEGYRVEEAKACIRDFAKFYINNLNNTDYRHDERWNDLHMLFGACCALAELQAALPGEIITDYPLKLVLDRRPFI